MSKHPLNDPVAEEAIGWLVQIQSGDFTPAQQEALDEWRGGCGVCVYTCLHVTYLDAAVVINHSIHECIRCSFGMLLFEQ